MKNCPDVFDSVIGVGSKSLPYVGNSDAGLENGPNVCRVVSDQGDIVGSESSLDVGDSDESACSENGLTLCPVVSDSGSGVGSETGPHVGSSVTRAGSEEGPKFHSVVFDCGVGAGSESGPHVGSSVISAGSEESPKFGSDVIDCGVGVGSESGPHVCIAVSEEILKSCLVVNASVTVCSESNLDFGNLRRGAPTEDGVVAPKFGINVGDCCSVLV